MDKTIKKIIELNKRFYLDKEFNNDVYVQELISIMQSYTLDYNMYLQIQNMGYLSQFIKTELNHFSFSNSDFYNSSSKSGTTIPTLSELSTVETEDGESIVHPMLNNNQNPVCFDNDDFFNTLDTHNNVANDDNVDNDETFNTEPIIIENTYEPDPTLDYIDQCCARVDNEIYNLDDYDPEFIDNYPSGVYINNSGAIIGSSCCNTVNEFNEFDNIFCEEHRDGFEDIREQPLMDM
jgi:hypothetical protein